MFDVRETSLRAVRQQLHTHSIAPRTSQRGSSTPGSTGRRPSRRSGSRSCRTRARHMAATSCAGAARSRGCSSSGGPAERSRAPWRCCPGGGCWEGARVRGLRCVRRVARLCVVATRTLEDADGEHAGPKLLRPAGGLRGLRARGDRRRRAGDGSALLRILRLCVSLRNRF